MKDPVRILQDHFPPTTSEEWEAVLSKDLKGADYRDILRWSTREGFDVLPFYRTSTDEHLHAHSTSDGFPKKDGLVFVREARPDDPFSALFEATLDAHGKKTSRKSLEKTVAEHLFSEKPIDIDGCSYHEAGATMIQELAAALATVNEYMALAARSAEAAGSSSGQALSAEDLSGRFVTYLSAGSLYFPEIAKFRAWRTLFHGLMCLYGDASPAHAPATAISPATALSPVSTPAPAPAKIHAVTSARNKSLRNPHDNLIRLTTEAMSAIVGGADRITIRADVTGETDGRAFQARMAENMFHLLKLESHLDHVANPADGCYYIDELTNQLAEHAWDLFREMEQTGGFVDALVSGRLAADVNAANRERLMDLKEGRTDRMDSQAYLEDRATHLEDRATHLEDQLIKLEDRTSSPEDRT